MRPGLMVANHSQIVHRTGMLRLLGQDLPIKLLGLAQSSGLVVLQCQIEGLLDRELGHDWRWHYPARIARWQENVMCCHLRICPPQRDHCGGVLDGWVEAESTVFIFQGSQALFWHKTGQVRRPCGTS